MEDGDYEGSLSFISWMDELCIVGGLECIYRVD